MTKASFYVLELVIFVLMFVLSLFLLAGCASNPYYSGTATQHLAGKP